MPIIELPDKGIELEFPDDMAMDAIEAAIKAEFYPSAEPTLPEPTLMPAHAQDPAALPDSVLTPPAPVDPGQPSKFEQFKDSFGKRADGTQKGPGFLGELQRPDGKVSTEISIGVEMEGEEIEIPSLVPTLSQVEVDHLLSGGEMTDEIVAKAVDHARKRMSEGKSPFADRPAAPQVPDLGIDTAPPELPADAAPGSPIPAMADLIPELADMTPEERAAHPFALGEVAVDYWSQFLMTPEDEAALMAKHPTAMAARYAAASLLLPGVSEKFASPIEMEKFSNLSTKEQKEEILGLAAGYAVFGAGAGGARALALNAVKNYPILSKSIGQLFKESNWFRRMTNRERGLVLQSIDDMARAGASEAKILREMKNRGLEKEAYERFAKSQGIDPEAPEAFDMPITPEKPASPDVALGSPLKPIKKGLPEPPTAKFLGWQEDGKGGHVALYNVIGGKLDKSTATAKTLFKEGIEAPETPPVGTGPVIELGPEELKEIEAPELPERSVYDILKEDGSLDIARKNYENYKDYIENALPAGGEPLPFKEWLERGRILPEKDVPAALLSDQQPGPEAGPGQEGRLPDDSGITAPPKPEPVPKKKIEPPAAEPVPEAPDAPKPEKPSETERIKTRIAEIQDYLVDNISTLSIASKGAARVRIGRLQEQLDALQPKLEAPEEPGAKPARRPRKRKVMPGDIGPGVRSLRGAIKGLGGINPLNMKGETADAPVGVKFLLKKSGLPYDLVIDQLLDDGWITKAESEDFWGLLTSGSGAYPGKKILSRDRVVRHEMGADKPAWQKSKEELDIEAELEREAPVDEMEDVPEGEYVTMSAADLPDGEQLTIIDAKSKAGWDIYEVQQEPWETKLIDGETVTLNPGDRVEVLRKDLPGQTGGQREAPTRTTPKPSKLQKFKESFKPKKSATMAALIKKAQERPADLQGTLNTIAATEKALEAAIKKGDETAADTFRANIKALKKLRQEQGGKAEFVERVKPQKQDGLFKGKFEEKEDVGSLFDGTGQADVGGYSKDIPAILEMPELLEIFRDVMDGKLPRIKEKIRGLAVGRFRHTGDIEIEAHLFEDPLEALKVMAHEIGHWIDWLPDKNMKRGNILGRIASLSGQTKHWLDDILGGPGALNKADKKRLWQEAKDLMAGDKWIDEVITRELALDPQDILDVWNSGLPREALNQELLDYIMGIDTAAKKAIVLAAMKGLVPNELKRFKQIIQEKTGKKIKVKIKASDKEVIDKYKNLILDELKKRNIYNRDEIMKELKTFTHIWKPFDRTADPKHTKYRYSGVELYADAVSGILTNSPLLRSVAPKFYSAWFTWLHRKPELLKAYRAIQDRKSAGTVEITRKRMENIYEMFKSGDEARVEGYMERRQSTLVSAWDGIATYLFDKNHAALKIIRRLEKQSGLVGKHAQNTRWMLEELNYLASEANVYTHDAFRHVIDPLKDAGHDLKELGLVLFQRRVRGDRSKIGNPLGHSAETVGVDMANIEQHIWGPEKTAEIHRLAETLRTLREDFILSTVRESGIATPEFMEHIENTKDYATFSNVAWFKNNYGEGPGAGFYRQIGTLGGIENPVVSLILKDLSTLRAARINMVKRELLVDLFYSGAAEPAKMKWSKDVGTKGGRVPVDPPDPLQALFSVLVDGKPEHFYVSKKIVDMFKRAPAEAHQTAIIWRYLSAPVKKILIQYNPIWMLRNVFRDFRQTGKNISEIQVRHLFRLAKFYKDALPEVWAEIMGNERSDTIRYMLEQKAIPHGRIWTAKSESFDTELDRMAEEFDISISDPVKAQKAWGQLRRVVNTVDKMGQVSDIWGKVAGFKYMQAHSKRGPRERASLTRKLIGTPDYRIKGTGSAFTNNMFIFSDIGREGIKASVQAIQEDPGGYAWKTIVMNILPKIIAAVVGAGITAQIVKRATGLDEDDEPIRQLKHYQRIYEGISEYDKAHYTIIPLGLTDNGISVFLRIPEDYEGQFWGALFHKLMAGKIAGHDGVINLIKEASPYQWHPLLMAASRLTAFYIQGQNPVDEYRGRYIMPEIVFEAGGPEAHKSVARSVWLELGGGLLYIPPWDGLQMKRGEWEKRLKQFPFNFLGTFLRFSDRGITEKIDAELKAHRKEKARISIDTKKAFIELVNGEKITPEDAALILQKKKDQRRKIVLGLIARKYGSAYVRRLTSARGKEEVLIIFNLMLKDAPR